MLLIILIPMLILSVILYVSYTISVVKLAAHIKKLSIADLGSLSAFEYCEWYMLSNNSQFKSYIFNNDFPIDLHMGAKEALINTRNYYFGFLACIVSIIIFLLAYYTIFS
jgi:hypothetical protein